MSGAAIDRLIAQMRDQRKSWVELEPATVTAPAKRVQIIRPTETEQAGMLAKSEDGGFVLRVEIEHVQRHVVGWDGITEADLIGPAGSGDAPEFSAALWSEVVADRVEWTGIVAQALLDAVVAHQKATESDAGN